MNNVNFSWYGKQHQVVTELLKIKKNQILKYLSKKLYLALGSTVVNPIYFYIANFKQTFKAMKRRQHYETEGWAPTRDMSTSSGPSCSTSCVIQYTWENTKGWLKYLAQSPHWRPRRSSWFLAGMAIWGMNYWNKDSSFILSTPTTTTLFFHSFSLCLSNFEKVLFF